MEGAHAAGALTIDTVARPDGGERRITRLASGPAHRYAALVAASTPAIERALGDEVVANRAVGRGRRHTTSLEPWRGARVEWRRRIGEMAEGATPVVLVCDVANCYGDLDAGVVMQRLRAGRWGGAARSIRWNGVCGGWPSAARRACRSARLRRRSSPTSPSRTWTRTCASPACAISGGSTTW